MPVRRPGDATAWVVPSASVTRGSLGQASWVDGRREGTEALPYGIPASVPVRRPGDAPARFVPPFPVTRGSLGQASWVDGRREGTEALPYGIPAGAPVPVTRPRGLYESPRENFFAFCSTAARYAILQRWNHQPHSLHPKPNHCWPSASIADSVCPPARRMRCFSLRRTARVAAFS